MKVKRRLAAPGSVVAEREGRRCPGCFRGMFLTADTPTQHCYRGHRANGHIRAGFLRGHASLLNLSAFVLVYEGKAFLSCNREKLEESDQTGLEESFPSRENLRTRRQLQLHPKNWIYGYISCVLELLVDPRVFITRGLIR